MKYLICYDISTPRQLQKTHKFLKDFGLPIQKSVFECDLSESDLLMIQKYLEKNLSNKNDSIIIYRLCKTCLERIVTSGVPRSPEHSQFIII